jgi:hypothetical protein
MHTTHLLVGYNLYNPFTFYLALSSFNKKDCLTRLKKTSIILLDRLLLEQVLPKISEASSFFINVDKWSRSLLDAREAREGWPLLTVETEVNGDSNERVLGFLPWLVRWSCRAMTVQEIYSALAALVGQLENIFFLTVHYFNCFVPIAQQEPCWVACNLACVSVDTLAALRMRIDRYRVQN